MSPFQTVPSAKMAATLAKRARASAHMLMAHTHTLKYTQSMAKNRKLNIFSALKTAFPQSSLDPSLPVRMCVFVNMHAQKRGYTHTHTLTAKDSCSSLPPDSQKRSERMRTEGEKERKMEESSREGEGGHERALFLAALMAFTDTD